MAVYTVVVTKTWTFEVEAATSAEDAARRAEHSVKHFRLYGIRQTNESDPVAEVVNHGK